jgi:AcrR family transcriptional regulator
MAPSTRPAADAPNTPRRRYRSTRRAEQAQETRSALLQAATTLFTTRGWSATGMRDIAEEAGVATETVYSHFRSKTELFQRVADAAVGGDEAPVTVAERPEFALIGEGTRAERIAAAAHLTTQIHSRTSGLNKVLREAATGDEAIAAMLSAARERQRLDVEAGAALLMGRVPAANERDGLWALLSVEVYLLLVEVTGWSPAAYEAWLAETLELLVPRS